MFRRVRNVNFADLSAVGEKTLKQRYDMLVEHKKDLENQIRELKRHLENSGKLPLPHFAFQSSLFYPTTTRFYQPGFIVESV